MISFSLENERSLLPILYNENRYSYYKDNTYLKLVLFKIGSERFFLGKTTVLTKHIWVYLNVDSPQSWFHVSREFKNNKIRVLKINCDIFIENVQLIKILT